MRDSEKVKRATECLCKLYEEILANGENSLKARDLDFQMNEIVSDMSDGEFDCTVKYAVSLDAAHGIY